MHPYKYSDEDLYYTITKYSELVINNDNIEFNNPYLIEILEEMIKRKRKTSKTKERALHEYIERLNYEIDDMKKQVAEAKAAEKKAKNKLRIFLKVISKFGLVDKLKSETEKVIQEEKDYLVFSKFFQNKINSLTKEEEETNELDKLFDK